MTNTIQVRRGLNSAKPQLAVGELGFSTDTKQIYVGDGTAPNTEIITQNTFAADSFLYATSAYTPQTKTKAQVVALLSGTATADFSMNSNKITSLSTPISGTDAATKAYVDGVATGLDVKASVRVATTVAGTLASSFANGQVIDTKTLVTGNRILIKDQATQTENGIYTVNASGAPTRATDADADAEVTSGMFTFVSDGSANISKGFVLTTLDPITVGSSNLVFSQFSSSGVVSGGTPALTLGTANSAGSSANFLRVDDTILAFDVTVPVTQAFGDSAAVGTATVAARRDHKHAMMALPAIDATGAATDITTRDASTTAHGLVVKAVAPASTMINVVGIGNGETVYANKALFDATSPTTQAFADSAAVGTAVAAARRDHKHAMMAAPTTVSGNAGSATYASAVTIADDTTTAAVMYPVWVAANTGNIVEKVSSTKLSFYPSTGALTATVLNGSLDGGAY